MKNLRENKKFTELWNEISEDYFEDNSLKELQALNFKYGDGHKWCSWYHNIRGLVSHDAPKQIIQQAIDLYVKYEILNAKHDTMCHVWWALDSEDNELDAETE